MERALSVFERLRGPVVPINICFTEAGEIDYVAVRRYVNWLCEERAPVLLLTYGSSEFSWISDEDLWRLTAQLAEEVAGRSLFVASTGFWTPEVCRGFLKHADRVGADAVKVQVNPWAGAGAPEVFVGYHDRIQDAAPIPLLLWCNSGGTGAVPVDVIAELARRPRFVGVKNDEDPFYYYYDLIRATRDSDFAVISGGQMRNFVLGYQVGSPAYLCTIAPFRPDVALRFYQLLVERRFDDAWEMVFRYEDPWLKLASEMGWLRSIKTAIHLRGVHPSNRPYPLSRAHDEAEQQRIRGCLEEVFGPIEKVDL